jgi:hypothetical protein
MGQRDLPGWLVGIHRDPLRVNGILPGNPGNAQSYQYQRKE